MSNRAKYAIGCAFVFLVFTVPGFSQTSSPTPATVEFSKIADEKIEQSEKRVADRLEKYCDERMEKLEGRFDAAEASLEKRSDKQVDSMGKLFAETRDSFKWLIEWSSLIVGILVGIAGFLIWKGEKNLKEFLEKRTDSIKQEIVASQEDLRDKLHKANDLKREYESALSEIESLKKQLQTMTGRDKKIVWTYETKGIDASSEISDIRENGSKVRVVEPGRETSIPPKECDLLIYSFNKSENSVERLKEIVRYLKSSGRNIPLIIYTYNNGDPKHLEKPENEVLHEYKYHVMANMPLTLRSYFDSLIRM